MSEPIVHEELVRESPFVTMTLRELIATAIWGVVIGLVTAFIYIMLYKFVFSTVLCRAQSTGSCDQAPSYAAIVTLIISLVAGVGALARLRIYRPLLVVIAALVSLWGLQSDVMGMPWYWAVPATAVLFGLAYALYAWLSRIRNFILAIVVIAVVVILVRWMLVA